MDQIRHTLLAQAMPFLALVSMWFWPDCFQSPLEMWRVSIHSVVWRDDARKGQRMDVQERRVDTKSLVRFVFLFSNNQKYVRKMIAVWLWLRTIRIRDKNIIRQIKSANRMTWETGSHCHTTRFSDQSCCRDWGER